MFRNVYLRAAGGDPFTMGGWPTREKADEIAAYNVSARLHRIDVEEEEDEPCPECEGSGIISGFIGTFGTLDCHGPSESECWDCNGTGVR